jgi:hypothetical protein
MAHEPYCNCCGCSQLRIIDAGFASQLNVGGPFTDYPTSSPTTVTVVDATWVFAAISASYGGTAFVSGGSCFGGKSKLDLNASQIKANSAYVPLIGINGSYVYPSGSPPQQSARESNLALSLYDDAESTLTGELVERSLPSDADDYWIIGYDPEQSFRAIYSDWPGTLWPAQVAYGFRENKYFYGTPFTGSLYDIYLQGAVVEQFDYVGPANPYPNQPERFLVSAFFDLPEPAATVSGKSLPSHSGTPLSSFKERKLDGIESFNVYAENLSLCSYSPLGTLPSYGYGWNVIENPPAGGGLHPPIIVGFDIKLTIAMGGSERLVNVFQPGANTLRLTSALGCVANPNGENPPTQGFFTAWVHRGDGIGVSEPGGQGYPVTGSHSTVTIFRNGEQVFTGNNPTGQQIEDAHEEDGSYLTVTEVDDRSLSPWTQPYPDARRHAPRMLKEFSSRVVDSVKPVIGFTPPNDRYGLTGNFPSGRVVATEPVTSASPNFQVLGDEDPTSVLTRPTGLRGFSTPQVFYEQPGTYTLRLFDQNTFTDIGGNKVSRVPTVQWTSHQWPAGANLANPKIGHLGATPTLEDPGLQTKEYWRPRLDTEPVSSLLLTFDLSVVPEQVSADQLTLTKDGEGVDGCDLEQVSDTQWRVSIPTAGQTPRSFWMLTYDPGGVVYRNDTIPEKRYNTRAEFPAAGELRTIYIHKDEQENDLRFYYGRLEGAMTGPAAYHQIGGEEPPRDFFGIAYEPEASILATRAGWLMADMDGYPRLIDTSSTTGEFQIGRVVSVSESQSLDADKNKSVVGTSGGLLLDSQPALGTYSPLLNYKGYTPSVPSLTSPADDSSYFGLTTTIDPCTPAMVSACAFPSSPQKHASAIRCNSDIESIKVSMVAINSNGNSSDLSAVTYPTYSENNYYGGSTDFSVNRDQTTFNAQGNRVAAFLIAKSGQPYTFGKTLAGNELSQNVWSCVESARATEMPVQPASTVKFDKTSFSFSVNMGSYTDNFTKNFAGDYGISEPLTQIAFTHKNPDAEATQESDLEPLPGNRGGMVRRIVSGNIKQTGLQGCVSAYRQHRTFPALKTTTLGELCISLSFRMALKVTLNYADKKVKPKLWYRQRGAFGITPYAFGTFNEVKQVYVDAGFGGIPATQISLQAFCSWDEGESGTERTVTHQFLADLEDRFALSKEKEESLANGQPVYVAVQVSRIPDMPSAVGTLYWKLQKG